MKTADFSAHLTEFLSHYLPELKNISTNTISSYCDAFRLFLGYCQDVEGMRIEKLSIDDLTPELVDHFLQWLRIERNNGTATRSQRLAAIRSFVKYLQIKEPRLLLNFQQILAIPVKRAERKAINPLTKEAIALILRQPDTSTLSGRRDATILCFLYDTAARVQEICDLRIEDVRLDYPASVKILGKGRKTRVVPILPATAQNLKKYLTEMHMLAPEKSHLPLFMNRNGQKLTRAGVTYILNKYAKAASVIDPSISAAVIDSVINSFVYRCDEEDYFEWTSSQKCFDFSPLKQKAVTAIGAILSDNSELRELWEENEELYEAWKEDKLSMQKRLQQ